jgi:hypothetical protein
MSIFVRICLVCALTTSVEPTQYECQVDR